MSTPPQRQPAYKIFKDKHWTPEMEAEVDKLLATSVGMTNAMNQDGSYGQAVRGPPRQAMVHHVAAERFKDASETVVAEVNKAQGKLCAQEMERWEEKFTGGPASAEEAEEYV